MASSSTVVAGVPLDYELSNEEPVVDWLTLIVKDALYNIGLKLDEEPLRKLAALSWCQMQTVKALRARKANAPEVYQSRLNALASRVLYAAMSWDKEQELDKEQAMELQDLGLAITAEVDDKLAAKVAVQLSPATAPEATTNEVRCVSTP